MCRKKICTYLYIPEKNKFPLCSGKFRQKIISSLFKKRFPLCVGNFRYVSEISDMCRYVSEISDMCRKISGMCRKFPVCVGKFPVCVGNFRHVSENFQHTISCLHDSADVFPGNMLAYFLHIFYISCRTVKFPPTHSC